MTNLDMSILDAPHTKPIPNPRQEDVYKMTDEYKLKKTNEHLEYLEEIKNTPLP